MEGDIDVEGYRKVLVSGQHQTIDEILEDFKSFLLACQFSAKIVAEINNDGDL
ncbi:MAG: hypothetical protein WCP65_00195 [Bacteroidota bacterium]